jgi:hypothetical protein
MMGCGRTALTKELTVVTFANVFRALARPAVRRTLAGVIAAEVVAVTAVWWFERSDLRSKQNAVTYNTRDIGPDFRKTAAPSIRLPPVVKAVDASLDAEEEVIGVVFEGKARAYRLNALRDRDHHVVNDVVGGVPVSVAFCDLNNCVRVYTDPRGPRSEPLDVASAGVVDGAMVVTIDGTLYLQESGLPMEPGQAAMPYTAITPERVSWAEWSRRHPDTEVFVAAPRRR